MTNKPSPSIFFIAALFIVAGALHFLAPKPYLAIMPPFLPFPLFLVYLSGLVEILGGAGVLLPYFRRVAGIAIIALLAAVFPANIQMLLGAIHSHANATAQILLWLRLPIQPLLMLWVWRATQTSHHATR